MDIEKARQFLTKKGWDKSNPTVGGVFFEGIAELLAEYEAKVIAVQPDVSGNEANPSANKKDGEVAVCNCNKGGAFCFNEVTQELYCECGRRIKVTN